MFVSHFTKLLCRWDLVDYYIDKLVGPSTRLCRCDDISPIMQYVKPWEPSIILITFYHDLLLYIFSLQKCKANWKYLLVIYKIRKFTWLCFLPFYLMEKGYISPFYFCKFSACHYIKVIISPHFYFQNEKRSAKMWKEL